MGEVTHVGPEQRTIDVNIQEVTVMRHTQHHARTYIGRPLLVVIVTVFYLTVYETGTKIVVKHRSRQYL